jgi:hypothetical protein
MSLTFQGKHAEILADTTTPELCVLGARDSGKTTCCIYKELQQLVKYPNLKSFLFRFSDKDTQSKLVPFFREMAHDEFNETPKWDGDESCFNFANGAVAYMYGLQATSQRQRYSKMRGLGVARVFAEQAEEIPDDIGLELRAALRQPGFDHAYQLTYCANPPPRKHWLVTQFPATQRMKGRRLFALSIYDNAHNLSPQTIERLEAAFPIKHPKHRTIILGLPGVNVTGQPVYGELFDHALHQTPVAHDPKRPFYECFDFGQQNPCWVAAQRTAAGGLAWLGGIMAQHLFLADFLPIVQEQRAEWFPTLPAATVRTCCTLSVPRDKGGSVIGLEQLRAAGYAPTWTPGSNSPDIVLDQIERQAKLLRSRGADGRELLAVNNDPTRWLTAASDGVEHSPFMAEAYGGGYAWSEHTVSVGRNEVKQPEADDWFEYPMRAAEALLLNFHGRSTQAIVDQAKQIHADLLTPSRAGWTG